VLNSAGADSRVETLERQLEELRDKLDCLQADLTAKITTPVEWSLSPGERALFSCLVRNEVMSKNMALSALYGEGGAKERHAIDVRISRIRAKTKEFGVEIKTIRKVGYHLINRAQWAKALNVETVEHN
jgi:DNA-binding response OmpR family regulator